MSGPFESEFAQTNLLRGIQDQQSVPRADILTGFAAIDEAISHAAEAYEIGDDSRHVGEVAFHDPDEGRLVIASHKIVAPTGTLPGAPVAQVGGVFAYDLRRHEPSNPANKDQDGWSLYLPEHNVSDGNLGRGQAWEQRAGRRRSITFAVGQLAGTLGMAQHFGEAISLDEARHLLEKRY
jgi:hypothetical protein